MKNDPFEVHHIDHLSPSSVNCYIDDIPLWIMRYLYGFRNGGGPAMWRGTVVDHAVGNIFGLNEHSNQLSIPEALKESELEYKKLYHYCRKEYPEQNIDENQYKREGNNVSTYTKTALDFYKKIGQPTEYQKEINLMLEDIPVPVRGYIDLQYQDIIRDIKTTGRMPSKVSDAHARQVSVYAKALDCSPVLDYIHVSAKENQVVTMPVDNVDEHITVVRQVALAIMNLLSFSNDKQVIANLFYPNFDDWKWKEDEINFAKTIWSIK